MISGSPIGTRFEAVQPLATGVGPGVKVGVGSGVGASGVGETDGAADAVTEGGGEAEAQPATTRTAARRNAAGRRAPPGIGLVGVVLEPAHRGEGGGAQELGFALQDCQLGAETGRRIGCLEQSLLA